MQSKNEITEHPSPPISMLGRVPLPSCCELMLFRNVARSPVVNIDIGGKGGGRCGQALWSAFAIYLPPTVNDPRFGMSFLRHSDGRLGHHSSQLLAWRARRRGARSALWRRARTVPGRDRPACPAARPPARPTAFAPRQSARALVGPRARPLVCPPAGPPDRLLPAWTISLAILLAIYWRSIGDPIGDPIGDLLAILCFAHFYVFRIKKEFCISLF